MRRILIEQARRRGSKKRAGDLRRVELELVGSVAAADSPDAGAVDDILEIDEALTELGSFDPLKEQLVKLRYFAGLTLEEAAEALGISVASAKRHWVYARSWRFGKLRGR
jgi:RNA polymerase sigma factor (TIGR02999 family)